MSLLGTFNCRPSPIREPNVRAAALLALFPTLQWLIRAAEDPVARHPKHPPETLDFMCYDRNNNEVKFRPIEEAPPPRHRR